MTVVEQVSGTKTALLGEKPGFPTPVSPIRGQQHLTGGLPAFARTYNYPRSVGGSLDFGGEGYGIEFDTYPAENPTDPHGQHIGLLKDNTHTHLTSYVVTDGFKDNLWHHVRVIFTSGRVTVCYDGNETISGYSIPDYTVLTGYFGFTASSGNGYEWHIVRDIRVFVNQHSIAISCAQSLP